MRIEHMGESMTRIWASANDTALFAKAKLGGNWLSCPIAVKTLDIEINGLRQLVRVRIGGRNMEETRTPLKVISDFVAYALAGEKK